MPATRVDSSKSVVHDDGRRKGPGPEALEAGVFALRSLEETARRKRGQPCPRELDWEPGTRGHGCPRSNLESALEGGVPGVVFVALRCQCSIPWACSSNPNPPPHVQGLGH